MKVNELMIGDWVKYGNRFAIIQSITPNECCILVSCSGSDELIWETYDNIEPIPITPEILEKIGFKKDERDENFYKWNWSVIDDCISYDKETGMVRIFYTSGLVFVKILSYLHELQHALRLCKIDKTITL